MAYFVEVTGTNAITTNLVRALVKALPRDVYTNTSGVNQSAYNEFISELTVGGIPHQASITFAGNAVCVGERRIEMPKKASPSVVNKLRVMLANAVVLPVITNYICNDEYRTLDLLGVVKYNHEDGTFILNGISHKTSTYCGTGSVTEPRLKLNEEIEAAYKRLYS